MRRETIGKMKNKEIVFGIRAIPQGTERVIRFNIVSVKDMDAISDLTMKLMEFYTDIEVIPLGDFVKLRDDK